MVGTQQERNRAPGNIKERFPIQILSPDKGFKSEYRRSKDEFPLLDCDATENATFTHSVYRYLIILTRGYTFEFQLPIIDPRSLRKKYREGTKRRKKRITHERMMHHNKNSNKNNKDNNSSNHNNKLITLPRQPFPAPCDDMPWGGKLDNPVSRWIHGCHSTHCRAPPSPPPPPKKKKTRQWHFLLTGSIPPQPGVAGGALHLNPVQ